MSWKQFGGINKFDKINNLNVNTIFADNMTLRNSYLGTLDICGNVAIKNNLIVDGNIDFNSRLYVQKDLEVDGNFKLLGNSICYSNSTTAGNVEMQSNVLIYDNLYLGSGSTTYFYGDSTGIGVNKTNPETTFDIYGTNTATLNVYSTQTTNRNILARNVNNQGIQLTTNSSTSSIGFFNDQTITSSNYDGQIQYQTGGVMVIDVSDNTQILSKVAISNRNSVEHILNENTVIYDICGSVFLYDVYNNSKYYSGNAVSLVASDNSYNTFLNIITPNHTGLSIGGGSYVNDSHRAMGTIGCIDKSGNYVPNQNIIRGNSLVHNKTTLGINTHAPRTENYTLDVNGPLHLTNGELTKVNSSTFEAKYINFSKEYPNYGLSVGTPYNISDNTFYQKVLYTSDGGKSWESSRISDSFYTTSHSTDLEGNNNVLYSAYVYDQSYSIIGGDSGYLFYSNDGGSSWNNFTIESGKNATIYSIHIADITNSNNKRVVLTYDASFVYFDVSFTLFDKYMELSQSYSVTSSSTNYVSPSPVIDLNSSSGYGNYIFIAGGGIQKYDLSTSSFVSSCVHSIPSPANTYNSIYTYDSNYVIAVGNYIISYSKNGGQTWTDITTDSVLQSVNMYDASNAIAVGNSGKIMYTKTSGDVWFTASGDILNSSGNETRLNNTSYQLTSVSIYDPNAFVVSTVTTEYDFTDTTTYTLGKTDIVYCYLPNVLNRENHYVLDACGNMRLWGDIWIGDDGSYGIIQSSNPVFNLLDHSVDEIYFGSDATMIMMGKDGEGSTYIQHSVDISKNLTVRGSLTIYGYQIIEGLTTYNATLSVNGYGQFGNTTTSTSSTTGAVTVSGGVGIAKDLYIGGNTRLNTDLFVDGNTYLGNVSGITYIGNSSVNTLATSSSTGTLVVTGGVGISGNIYLDGSAVFNNIVKISNTTNSASDSSGAFRVVGGMSVGGNSYVGGNIRITSNTESTGVNSGSLQVIGGTYISGNTYIAGNTRVKNVCYLDTDTVYNSTYGTVSTSGALRITNGGASIAGNVIIYSSAAPTTSTTGALVIVGGAAIGGNVRISSTANSSSDSSGAFSVFGGITVAGNTFIAGNTNIYGNIESTSKTTGTLIVTGGLGISGNTCIGGNIYVGGNSYLGNVSGVTYIGNSSVNTGSTSSATGALVVYGGAGISGNVYVDGSSVFANTVNISNTTNSSGESTGAFQVAGGMSVSKNSYVGGNVVITSTTTLSGTATTQGALIVSGGAAFQSALNIAGIVTITSTQPTTNSTSNNGALQVKGGGYYDGNLYAGASVFIGGNTSTTSNSSTTGSLIVTGGVGVSGNVNVGTSGILVLSNTTVSSGSGTGALQISGGAYVAGNSYLAGVITMTNTTVSNSSTSGALKISGGVGISGNVYIGGSTASSSSTSGTLVVTGGAGISGNTNIGGNVTIAGGNTATSYTGGALVVTGSAGFSANIYCNNYTNSVYFNATSDYRIKTDVTPLDSSYNVDSLKPIHYINTRGNKEDIGFIAHEVQEIYPFLVSGEKDGTEYQSINYNGFIGILVKEIQDLKKTVAELQNKVSEIQDLRV